MAGTRRSPAHPRATPQEGGSHLGLIEELRVSENIQLPARLGQRPAVEGRAEELMDSLGLSQFTDRMPTEISLGEQQRTGLARALVSNPRLLLADEPTGHQDAVWGRGVLRTIRRACEQGTTCLVATHNEEILKYVDRVLAIRDGEVHEEQRGVARTEDAH